MEVDSDEFSSSSEDDSDGEHDIYNVNWRDMENIRVLCRFRPVNSREKREEKMQDMRDTPPLIENNFRRVKVMRPPDAAKKGHAEFDLDHIFDGKTTQQQVFLIGGKPMVDACVHGFNATIFAYGQTGSGKTFTMFGPDKPIPSAGSDPSAALHYLGLVQRCVTYLFEELLKYSAVPDELIEEDRDCTPETGAGNSDMDSDSGSINTVSSKQKKKKKKKDTSDSGGEGARSRVKEYHVYVSFTQLYKEMLFDLLKATKVGAGGVGDEAALKAQSLKIRYDPKRSCPYVPGLKHVKVKDISELLPLLAMAQNNRITDATQMNATSSRSHMIMTLSVKQELEDGTIVESKLNFADLAGSEKFNKAIGASTDAHGKAVTKSAAEQAKQLQELKTINLSLTHLTSCINMLSQGRKPSYRSSQLTFLLTDSLGGNSKTTLIVAASPHVFNRVETISTLRFAKTAKAVKNQAKVNQELSREQLLALIKKLKKENKKLKAMLEFMKRELKKAGVELSKDALRGFVAAGESDGEGSRKRRKKKGTGSRRGSKRGSIAGEPALQTIGEHAAVDADDSSPSGTTTTARPSATAGSDESSTTVDDGSSEPVPSEDSKSAADQGGSKEGGTTAKKKSVKKVGRKKKVGGKKVGKKSALTKGGTEKKSSGKSSIKAGKPKTLAKALSEPISMVAEDEYDQELERPRLRDESSRDIYDSEPEPEETPPPPMMPMLKKKPSLRDVASMAFESMDLSSIANELNSEDLVAFVDELQEFQDEIQKQETEIDDLNRRLQEKDAELNMLTDEMLLQKSEMDDVIAKYSAIAKDFEQISDELLIAKEEKRELKEELSLLAEQKADELAAAESRESELRHMVADFEEMSEELRKRNEELVAEVGDLNELISSFQKSERETHERAVSMEQTTKAMIEKKKESDVYIESVSGLLDKFFLKSRAVSSGSFSEPFTLSSPKTSELSPPPLKEDAEHDDERDYHHVRRKTITLADELNVKRIGTQLGSLMTDMTSAIDLAEKKGFTRTRTSSVTESPSLKSMSSAIETSGSSGGPMMMQMRTLVKAVHCAAKNIDHVSDEAEGRIQRTIDSYEKQIEGIELSHATKTQSMSEEMKRKEDEIEKLKQQLQQAEDNLRSMEEQRRKMDSRPAHFKQETIFLSEDGVEMMNYADFAGGSGTVGYSAAAADELNHDSSNQQPVSLSEQLAYLKQATTRGGMMAMDEREASYIGASDDIIRTTTMLEQDMFPTAMMSSADYRKNSQWSIPSIAGQSTTTVGTAATTMTGVTGATGGLGSGKVGGGLSWKSQLTVGSKLDCKDDGGLWWTAKVKRVDSGRKRLLISYDGFDERWDEWIPMKSWRLQKYLTHAKGGKDTYGGIAAEIHVDLEVVARRGDHNIVKQGFMSKLGGTFKTYKNRFFTLDELGEMRYYKNMTDKRPIGQFNIMDLKETKKITFDPSGSPSASSTGSSSSASSANSDRRSFVKYLSSKARDMLTDGTDSGFSLELPKRTWKFRCDSDRVVDEWISVIHAVVAGVKPAGREKTLSTDGVYYEGMATKVDDGDGSPDADIYPDLPVPALIGPQQHVSSHPPLTRGDFIVTSRTSEAFNDDVIADAHCASSSNSDEEEVFEGAEESDTVVVHHRDRDQPMLTPVGSGGSRTSASNVSESAETPTHGSSSIIVGTLPSKLSIASDSTAIRKGSKLVVEEDVTIEISGFLYKQGKWASNWTRRWCEVVQKTDYVGSDQGCSYPSKSFITRVGGPSGKVTNSLDFTTIKSIQEFESSERHRQEIEMPTRFAFELICETRVYLFACEDDLDLKKWLKVIKSLLGLRGAKIPRYISSDADLVKLGRSVTGSAVSKSSLPPRARAGTLRQMGSAIHSGAKRLGRFINVVEDYTPVMETVKKSEVVIEPGYSSLRPEPLISKPASSRARTTTAGAVLRQSPSVPLLKSSTHTRSASMYPSGSLRRGSVSSADDSLVPGRRGSVKSMSEKERRRSSAPSSAEIRKHLDELSTLKQQQSALSQESLDEMMKDEDSKVDEDASLSEIE